MSRDKGSLTEQQTKGTVTITTQKRGIHRINQQNRARRTELLSQTALPLCPPEPRVTFRRAVPPLTGTQHDGTWYGIPGSVWPGWGWVSPPGCAPSWILVKINPVLAKPGTPTYKSSSCKIFGSLAGQFITFYVWLHHCHQLQNDCLLNISAKTLP